MIILGVNGRPVPGDKRERGHGGNHNSAACLIKDGKLLSFAEEERFTHKKHDGGFPINAITYCLEHAGITMEQVDIIAIGWKSFEETFAQRLGHFIRTGMIVKVPFFCAGISYFALRDWLAGDVHGAFKQHFPEAHLRNEQFYYVEHHLAHAASAYRASGYKSAAIVNFDGAGETTSTWLGHGKDGAIMVKKEFSLPDSLGFCYSGFTEYLGFMKNNDEYKVMGLASYGKPTKDVSGILDVQDGGYHVDIGSVYRFNPFKRKYSYRNLIRKFGPERPDDNSEITQEHKDIAASIQHQLERAGVMLVKEAMRRTGEKRVVLAGGVALNCKMNQRIREELKIKDMFVQPAASDMGVALGAALEVASRLGEPADFTMHHAYYGAEFTDKQIEAALKERELPYRRVKDISRIAAKHIHEKKVVGWFQGRFEAGPRALGNRSILANPTVKGMDDIVNEKIKFREKWRPFCPSLIVEAADRYFEDACEAPFMILTFRVKKAMRAKIPAVTHTDGTARPQTVRRSANPRYYDLIKEFGRLSGHPIVMNTSFNIKGDTIVNTPYDAIRTFLKTDMDVLAIGDFIVEKKDI